MVKKNSADLEYGHSYDDRLLRLEDTFNDLSRNDATQDAKLEAIKQQIAFGHEAILDKLSVVSHNVENLSLLFKEHQEQDFKIENKVVKIETILENKSVNSGEKSTILEFISEHWTKSLWLGALAVIHTLLGYLKVLKW